MRRDTYLRYDKKLKIREKIKKRSDFQVEFQTTDMDGVIFYIADKGHMDFIGLFLKNGQLVYGFNCGSGAGWIETEEAFNDGRWHTARFQRDGSRGHLYVDGNIMGEQTLFGDTKRMEVKPEFFLGGIADNMKDMDVVQKNLRVGNSSELNIVFVKFNCFYST